jgi:hypothetical protein
MISDEDLPTFTQSTADSNVDQHGFVQSTETMIVNRITFPFVPSNSDVGYLYKIRPTDEEVPHFGRAIHSEGMSYHLSCWSDLDSLSLGIGGKLITVDVEKKSSNPSMMHHDENVWEKEYILRSKKLNRLQGILRSEVSYLTSKSSHLFDVVKSLSRFTLQTPVRSLVLHKTFNSY